MAILNPEHLFEQAVRLTAAGSPRPVDLRRAISAAYYGLFHAILTAAADQFVGVTKRSTAHYGLVYRSTDHRRLRDLCTDVKKQTLPPKLARHVPAGGFGSDMVAFATIVIETQESRHSADYDPSIRIKSSDAILALLNARRAFNCFTNASAAEREAFLYLLLFQPR